MELRREHEADVASRMHLATVGPGSMLTKLIEHVGRATAAGDAPVAVLAT
jgi:hypothetical protein